MRVIGVVALLLPLSSAVLHAESAATLPKPRGVHVLTNRS